jgi:pyruvyl transferase EpsO
VAELEALKREIVTTLKSFTGRYSTCALVDFPNHWNVGDSAIWLGELEILRYLGIRVVYICDHASYRAEALKKLIGDGLILMSGGGNFGNLYAYHQRWRERILEDFPNNEIVQLPQTIWFTADDSIHGRELWRYVP